MLAFFQGEGVAQGDQVRKERLNGRIRDGSYLSVKPDADGVTRIFGRMWQDGEIGEVPNGDGQGYACSAPRLPPDRARP